MPRKHTTNCECLHCGTSYLRSACVVSLAVDTSAVPPLAPLVGTERRATLSCGPIAVLSPSTSLGGIEEYVCPKLRCGRTFKQKKDGYVHLGSHERCSVRHYCKICEDRYEGRTARFIDQLCSGFVVMCCRFSKYHTIHTDTEMPSLVTFLEQGKAL